MSLRTGEVVGGRFEVVGELGRGGMATVYLVQDRVRGKRVALKVLHAHLAHDPGMQARLRTELLAAERIRHEGALVPHELHELEGGQLALSLPYHPGRTLAEVVQAEGPLPVAQVRRLAARLSEVLAEAHRNGVVHRDISPHNVMLDDRGRPVLTDFGLARLQDQGTRRSTGVFGTTGFVAPEVFEGRRRDPRADLYALGGVLHFALTGKEPFKGAHPAAVLQQQLDGAHTHVSELREDVPEWLSGLVDDLLAPSPELRPQGAVHVLDAVRQETRPETASPPPEAAEAPPLATAALPAGPFTVALSQTSAQQEKRRRTKRWGRDMKKAPRIIRDIFDTLSKEGILPGSQDPGEVLHAQVASLAGVDRATLPSSPALDLEAFRIVEGVDQTTARILAETGKELGFEARVHQGVPEPALVALSKVWWIIFPLMWTLWPFSTTVGLPMVPVVIPVIITILWAILVPQLVEGAEQHAEDLDLPVAFPNAATLTRVVREAAPEPAKEAAEATLSSSPGQRVARRARTELLALAEELEARREELPAPVLLDLQQHHKALTRAVEQLAPQVGQLEAELARRDADQPEDLSWMESRLRRLETLERAGETVDPSERTRLEGALAAHAEASAGLASLESDLTAAMAALLELSAAASRARRELAGSDALAVSAPRLAEELDQRMRALEAARRELGNKR